MTTTFRHSLDAILFACGGWFLFCVCDAISKWLTGGYSPIQILAFNGAVGAMLAGGWIIARHGLTGFLTPQWKWYLIRSVAQAGSSYLVIKSLSLIPMADFYGIVFLAPMMTTVLATFMLKEKIGIYRLLAIIVGFVGVLIIAGPSFESHNVGYLYALVAVVFISLSAIFVRKIGRETVPARYAFFPFVTNAIVYVPLALAGDFKMPVNALDLSLLLLFAPLALLGLLGYSTGFSRARDTALIAPFHYTQMIWGALFGFLLFGDVPALTTYAGSALIVVAGMLVIWREHIHHKQIAARAPETIL